MSITALELDEFSRPAAIRYSICTLVNRPNQYEEMLDSFHRGGFKSPSCEFLYIDNSCGNKRDGYAGINQFLCHAQGEYVILCHQDVRLIDAGRGSLDQAIQDITVKDPNWALLGNAGGVGLRGLAMRITDPYGEDRKSGKLPARVQSLDENFIVVRKMANLGLSRDLKGFHLYGTDLCMTARALGYTAYAVDFHLHHIGGPKSKRLDDEFYRARRAWIDKYQRLHATKWVRTPCTLMFVSNSRIVNRMLNRFAPILDKPIRKVCRSAGKRYQWSRNALARCCRSQPKPTRRTATEVLALVESPNHVCYRYRVKAYTAALAQHDLSLRPVVLRPRTLSRTRQLLDARRFQTVILQRRLLPRWQIRILRQAADRLVFDLDDAVFQRDSYDRKSQQCRRKMERFKATVRAADIVTVGNDHLRQEVLRYVESDRVRVIPTCVDPMLYRLANHSRADESLRLSWIGSSSTMPSLHLIQQHLALAAERVPGLELHVICDRGVELAGVRTVLREWSTENEAADLADCDVGISWLPDDTWSRGKCGLKVLQYMAAGLPVVANPVGTNPEMVIPGRTGFLANTPNEWAEAIRLLASDRKLRRKLGAAGRRLIQERYSVARWEDSFVAATTGTDDVPVTIRLRGAGYRPPPFAHPAYRPARAA